MLSTRHLEKYLEHVSPPLRDIVWEIRNIVVSIAPNATEVMHSKGMTYYHAERGGPVSAGICQIVIQTNHIRLAFIHGAFLPDPVGLLGGSPQYKKYIRIDSYDGANWDAIKDMIGASSRFDPRTLSVK
jgi:hypothetical protein